MKLYSNPLSPNCRKVHVLVAHTGLEVEPHVVKLMEGEQKKPEFLALNPNGKVPVVVDGDTRLWESNAILAYLAGKADSDLWPKSDARYTIMSWMFWESAHFSQALATIIGEKIFKPMRGAEADPKILEEGMTRYSALAAVLDGNLARHRFLTGDAMTIADISVGIWFGYQEICGLPVGETAHVKRWLGELDALPAWQQHAAPPAPPK